MLNKKSLDNIKEVLEAKIKKLGLWMMLIIRVL